MKIIYALIPALIIAGTLLLIDKNESQENKEIEPTIDSVEETLSLNLPQKRIAEISKKQVSMPLPNLASHPLVSYENPEKIRSFSDPKLLKAFNVYFSLIGEQRRKYPYSKSGFDTKFNAELAYKTVKGADYQNNLSASHFKEVIMAITHLRHSNSDVAREHTEKLTQELISRIESSKSHRVRKLTRADLKMLLSSEQQDHRLLTLYRQSQDSMVLQSIAYTLFMKKENEGLSDIEIRQYFASHGIAFDYEGDTLLQNERNS